MSIFRRYEDKADIWLREHDPYYIDSKKNKRKQLDYPYDTPEQERRKKEIEIPISNLNSSQRVMFTATAGEYDQDGEFNL